MEEIAEKIKDIVAGAFDLKTEVEVTAAPVGQKVAGKQADFASNVAMKVAGMMKKKVGSGDDLVRTAENTVMNPRKIAEDIMVALRNDEDFQFEVEIAGPGFLNFIARDEYWKEKIRAFSDTGKSRFDKNISCDVYSGETVICEFSDPNPFKVLHVGHLYTSVVGDAISRLVEFAGGEVVRANFGGDVGLHVAKTLFAVMRDGLDTSNIEAIAKCYVEGTRAYEEDEAAKAEITQLNKAIYEIAEAGPEKKWGNVDVADTDVNDVKMARVAKLYWEGRKVSYQYFEDFYKRVGVKFDKYYPESVVAPRGLLEVSRHIGDVYEKSDGAIVYKGEQDSLHTRVFINKEGLPTYEAKDVGLIFTKWDDYHFDKSIVITGNDIIDYMKVVLASVAKYAPELVKRTEHLTHGNVRLPGNEKMSSRKGNFVKAVEVLNSVEVLAKRSDLALAAIKYAFLKYKIGGNIEFDAKESVSTTGNSGVYLQYSAVRALKILEKVTDKKIGDDWELNEYEKELVRKVAAYKDVLAEAVKDLAPYKVANYLYEVAQEFSRFYEHVKVAGSDKEAERAQIVRAYLNVMTHGLGLLGIEVPEEM